MCFISERLGFSFPYKAWRAAQRLPKWEQCSLPIPLLDKSSLGKVLVVLVVLVCGSPGQQLGTVCRNWVLLDLWLWASH